MAASASTRCPINIASAPGVIICATRRRRGVPPVIAGGARPSGRNYGWEMPTPDNAYAYGVYNPVDGVGSPFFAGYYGPAGDDDDDNDSGFPFGHPYPPR